MDFSGPATLALAGLLTAVPQPPAAKDIRVREHVEVQRVLLDVRVVDSRGNPILGLGPEDFLVSVDGRPAALEWVEWVSGTQPYAEGLTPEQAARVGAEPAPQGRLIVYFFQTDFAGVRLSGLMHMKARAIRLLDTLTPGDRVAVVSFDSHLKLRQDFTDDRKKLSRAIHDAILFGKEPEAAPGPIPSLARSFDQAAAKAAAEPESGLLVTARALEALPGAKSLVYFGWGLGHLARPRVVMGCDYGAARAALARARVTVFAIDVTDADFHDVRLLCYPAGARPGPSLSLREAFSCPAGFRAVARAAHRAQPADPPSRATEQAQPGVRTLAVRMKPRQRYPTAERPLGTRTLRRHGSFSPRGGSHHHPPVLD